MFIATLIADGGLDDALVWDVAHEFDTECVAGRLESADWIDKGSAFDLVFDPAENFGLEDCAELARAVQHRALATAPGAASEPLKLDVIVQPAAHREKQLLVSDMDSTMITVECIDELADYAGIKPEIAAITERAMAGELDFEAALIERVALLKGLPVETLARCYEERVRFMPGAATLVATMRARGARTVLVSGGFTHFADRVASELGFDLAISNTLGVGDGRLDGTVAKPIVGAEAKRMALLDAMTPAGLRREQTLAIGDGANDVPMIEAAGLGVAYRAKPVVEAAAAASIRHGDLTALLWAQGIARVEWAI